MVTYAAPAVEKSYKTKTMEQNFKMINTWNRWVVVEKLMMASVIASGLFKAGECLTCQKLACDNRNTRCSLNIAIGSISSTLFVGHRFKQRDVPLLLTDFHFPNAIFRACGWMMGLQRVEHICEVKYSLVMPIETYSLCPFLNRFPPRLAWPFRRKPSHVPAIPTLLWRLVQ
jgi:hypothetical protein